MNRLLVILGPTSTGKTDLALSLAKKFNGELISCDSRQVYKGLDLGTGKLPDKDVKVERGDGYWVMDGVKIWLYDVVNPAKQYTVYNFVKDAQKAVKQITAENKLPIIVGGTGLYLKGLLEGFPNLGIPVSLNLRKKLEQSSLEELQNKLQKLSVRKWNLMNDSDRQNPRRLIRAIEIMSMSFRGGRGIFHLHGGGRLPRHPAKGGAPRDVLKIGLTGSREVLYKRIDERVITRINQGMIDEAENLYKNGLSLKRMRQLGLEYGALADYLEGLIDRNKLIKILQGKIHNYARRQITWFKKEKEVFWFDITNKNYLNQVENYIARWYHGLK